MINETTVKQRKPPPLSDSTNSLNELLLTQTDDKQQQTATNATFTLENICWFIASILCVYFTDIINVILYDNNIYRKLLIIAFILIGINIIIACYLIAYVTYIKKINSNRWNELYPALIPVATACFISGSIILTVALWPVYSWLTAPILFTIFMGFIVVIINFPNWI